MLISANFPKMLNARLPYYVRRCQHCKGSGKTPQFLGKIVKASVEKLHRSHFSKNHIKNIILYDAYLIQIYYQSLTQKRGVLPK